MLPHLENRRKVEQAAADYLVERDAAKNREERWKAKERYFKRTESM